MLAPYSWRVFFKPQDHAVIKVISTLIIIVILICVIAHLERYISLTQPLRGTADSLFISYCKPCKPVSKDTISRRVKHLLQESGIDIKTFSTHRTRAASTSKGCELGIPVEHILAAASWSNAKTFAKFYKKPIETTQSQTSFGKELLDCISK